MIRLLLLAALFTSLGCGLGGAPSTESIPPAEAAAMVADAKGKLAIAKGVDPSQITLKSVEAHDFNDSSLGCPEPGRSYMQAITPGYVIVLQLGTETYEFHAASGNVVRCDGK
jgi:hypothetical protein